MILLAISHDSPSGVEGSRGVWDVSSTSWEVVPGNSHTFENSKPHLLGFRFRVFWLIIRGLRRQVPKKGKVIKGPGKA